MNHGRLVVPFSDYLTYHNKAMQDQFQEVESHGETLVSITTAIVATIEEVESGSTFRKTCLATEDEMKPTMLHGVTPSKTYLATPLLISFS